MPISLASYAIAFITFSRIVTSSGLFLSIPAAMAIWHGNTVVFCICCPTPLSMSDAINKGISEIDWILSIKHFTSAFLPPKIMNPPIPFLTSSNIVS